jgi:hypothetical protein
MCLFQEMFDFENGMWTSVGKEFHHATKNGVACTLPQLATPQYRQSTLSRHNTDWGE